MALDLGIFLEGAGSSFKVKVSENDALAQFLKDKLVSTDGSVTITETNDGSTETLDLTVAGGSDTNIANTDLTQDGDRTLTQDGYDLIFDEGLAVGTSALDASAYFEVGGSSKGLLIPRVTTANMNLISSPATNLLVFNTDLSALYRYDGSNWVALSAGYGIIEVIRDSDSGVPTFYADLQSALETCKTTGSNNTVRLYSDITITSAISIKGDGSGTGNAFDYESLTIDFNGFKVINNEADGSYCFDLKSLTNKRNLFINGQIIRTSGTSGGTAINTNYALSEVNLNMSNMLVYSENGKAIHYRTSTPLSDNYNSYNDWGGSVFISDSDNAVYLLGNNSSDLLKVKNFIAIGRSSESSIYVASNSDINNFKSYNTSTGRSLELRGNSNAFDFECYSTSGDALYVVSVGSISRFYAESTTGSSVHIPSEATQPVELYNFKCLSTTGYAIRINEGNSTISNFRAENNGALETIHLDTSSNLYNGYAINKGAGQALWTDYTTRIKHCSFVSKGDQSATVRGVTGSSQVQKISFCSFESQYDDSNGHAVEVLDANSNLFFANCEFIVENSSANGVYASSAETVSIGNSSFHGATTPINANVTVSLTTAPDSNGNYTA